MAWLSVAVLLVLTGCPTASAPVEPGLPPGVPADQPVELFLGLARDQDGLQRAAAAGDSIDLTDVATRFGASAATRAALTAHFPAGLTFSATGGFARLELPIGRAEREFGVSWQVATDGHVQVLTATGTPTVPDDLRDQVTEVLPRNRVLRPGRGRRSRGRRSRGRPDGR